MDEAALGDEGLQLALSHPYDVIVLDLMLPVVDGFEILRRLRAEGRPSHVLILTARDAVGDRVKGLDLGGDDYLVKPFAMDELLARVRALLRRAYDKKDPMVSVGHVEIDMARHAVRVDGEAVELTAREYALLEYLALRRDQVVSRTDIWNHLYDEHATAASNVVDVYIGYLRRKLHRPGFADLIVTRRGEGYQLTDER